VKNYIQTQKLLLYRLLLIIAAYSVCRFLFYIFNTNYFRVDAIELLIAFVAGLRFDISAILYTNFIFILLHLIPGEWKYRKQVQKITFWIFIIVNSTFLLLNFIDIEYYSFVNKRSTWDLFYFVQTSGDIWNLIPVFIIDYWHIILLWGLTVFGLFKLYPGKKHEYRKTKLTLKTATYQTAISVAIFGLMIIGARGGLQLRPINTLTAVKYLKPNKVALVTNSTFTLINSYSPDRIEEVNYFPQKQLSDIFTPKQIYHQTKLPTKKNVIILILESFSAEYSLLLSGNDFGYTPFLDSLMLKSCYFTRAYSNCKKSMEALPAIISGIPALLENPYITSQYNSNMINSLPIVLEKYNYETFFFHGGINGTMGFDNFSKAAGIDNYIGQNEYVGNKADFDGSWGIYDEPYLQYIANYLDTVKSPFFAGIFTLSSHHPYKIPNEYSGKFPKGNIPILESIGYADYALQQFFDRISKSDWYKNTLFVLTADHTAQSYTPEFANMHGNYRIPLVFFDPSNEDMIGAKNHVVQQTDIFPSVINYLNLKDTILCYGTSVFNRDSGWAINYLNNVYQLIADSLLIQFDGEKLIGVYDPLNDKLLNKNLVKQHNYRELTELQLLKAIIQDYRYRLINNKLAVMPR
jgi:phosphoglycerol transferase MdoB-like AlkP superfamily enzyme